MDNVDMKEVAKDIAIATGAKLIEAFTHKIFGIYDRQNEAYIAPPFTEKTRGAGIRTFTNIVNDDQPNLVNRAIDDYSLHEIGEFCERTGKCRSIDKVDLGKAASYKKEAQ